MREALNADTLFATIAMFIQESHSLLLVVEGPDDHDALKRHCSADLNLMAGTGGRGQVLRAARLADTRGIKGVRFLVDRDYDGFLDASTIDSLGNVYISQSHDLFMDLIIAEPEALIRVIDAHTRASRRRPSQPGKRQLPDNESVCQEAQALALQLAAVRILNARTGLGLNFRRFSFGGLKVREFDVDSIFNIVAVRSALPTETRDLMAADARRIAAEIEKNSAAIGDHDLFESLSRVLRRYDIATSAETLLSSYLVAISCAAVATLSWFQELQDWCALNLRAGMNCDAGRTN